MFEVGQRVRITTNHRVANGKEGVITVIDRTLDEVCFYIVDFPGKTPGYIWNFAEDELELIEANTAPAHAASVPDNGSVFDLIERRIMKSGDTETRYLEGIDEPIGPETVRYINNQSIALHNANKVAEAFAGTLDEKYQTIGTLKAELASAMLRVTNMRRVLRDVMNTSGDGNSVLDATEALELDDKTHAKALQASVPADGAAWDDEHGGDYDDSVGGG